MITPIAIILWGLKKMRGEQSNNETVAKIIFFCMVGAASIVVFGLLYNFCGKKPEVKPIDEQTIQKVNSANESERREAVNQAFQQIDEQRAVSDEKRQQIAGKVDEAVRNGRNVTADDLHKLVEDNQ